MFDDEAGDNWVGSPKMKQISDRIKGFTIDWSCSPFSDDPVIISFCKPMLAVSEADRPKAEEVLQHQWLTGRPADALPKQQQQSR